MWFSRIRIEKPKRKTQPLFTVFMKCNLSLTTYLLGTGQEYPYINTVICSELLITSSQKRNNGCGFISCFPLPACFFKHDLVYVANWWEGALCLPSPRSPNDECLLDPAGAVSSSSAYAAEIHDLAVEVAMLCSLRFLLPLIQKLLLVDKFCFSSLLWGSGCAVLPKSELVTPQLV